MNRMEFLPPRNPIELARPFAEQLRNREDFHGFTRTDEEARLLGELNRVADDMDMLGIDYFVRATLAFRIPHDTDGEDTGVHTSYSKYTDGLIFQGNFCTHAIVKVGKLVNSPNAVRALCLTFDSANMLTDRNYLDSSEMLYVPVLAVHPESIEVI